MGRHRSISTKRSLFSKNECLDGSRSEETSGVVVPNLFTKTHTHWCSGLTEFDSHEFPSQLILL